MAAEAGPILNGIPSQLPDIDPEETQEWIDSLDAVLDEKGRTRARYVMLKLIERARATAGRRPVADGHRLHQHHPAGARAVVPRRRGGRARVAPLHPMERRGPGPPCPASGHRRRRPHLDLRVRGDPLRGGHEPLLPGQGPPRRRRPGLLPGSRLSRHVRPVLPRGAAVRGTARRVPTGEEPHRRRQDRGAAVLSAPSADVRLLGVPDGLDGPRPDERDLPGAVQQVPAQSRPQGHEPAARVGLPRRR